MYLPLGLQFLQLPLSLLDSGQPTSHSAISTSQSDCRDDLNHLGNLSPYHDAPSVPGVSANLPDDCTVERVVLLHRHGSRGPSDRENTKSESFYIRELAKTLEKQKEAIQEADLPSYLEFLKEGYEYNLEPDALTLLGRKELFDHGVRFAFRYPEAKFKTDLVVTTDVERVIDSAHFFVHGFFGREADKIEYELVDDDPVPYLAPWITCPNLKNADTQSQQTAGEWAAKYIPPIVTRFNTLIPNVQFTGDDIRGALYACPYDLAARNSSPWCGVFSSFELQGLEYELDLLLDGYTGYRSRNDLGPLAGALYVQRLIKRLTDTSESAKSLYLDFAHDINILLAMSTMVLNKDEVPLNSDRLRPNRKFRSSNQTPFAAEMVWEKFTCEESFDGPQVRLLLNGATFPLSFCNESDLDDEYGTCSLDAFVDLNDYSTSVVYKNDDWNTHCGVPKEDD